VQGNTRLYMVPYSEHSSFPELQAFVKAVQPRSGAHGTTCFPFLLAPDCTTMMICRGGRGDVPLFVGPGLLFRAGPLRDRAGWLKVTRSGSDLLIYHSLNRRLIPTVNASDPKRVEKMIQHFLPSMDLSQVGIVLCRHRCTASVRRTQVS
jgi:hypothetical protein